jgi:hypothetical protein
MSVKTIAQGMPDDPACGSFPVLFYCTGAMGEAFTRHSLRPLVFGGTLLMHHSGI